MFSIHMDTLQPLASALKKKMASILAKAALLSE